MRENLFELTPPIYDCKEMYKNKIQLTALDLSVGFSVVWNLHTTQVELVS